MPINKFNLRNKFNIISGIIIKKSFDINNKKIFKKIT